MNLNTPNAVALTSIQDRIGTPITLDRNACLTTSYSSFGMLGSCPRKYAKYKIYPDNELYRDESAALSQGRAVGHGYACWLETGNKDLAMLETWRHFYPPLIDNVRDITKACIIVQKLAEFDMQGWQLAVLNGKPCTETSFAIKLSDEVLYEDGSIRYPAIYFVGFLDAILQHSRSFDLLPLELKTTTLTANIRENFMNSSQGNGYGLVLDKIAAMIGRPVGLNYDIQYMVAQAHRAVADQYNPTIHFGNKFRFTKTISDRLEWLIDLKLTQGRILNYLDMDMFPRNGSSCLNYNKLCPFSGVCNLTNTQPPAWEQGRDPDLVTYDFYFDVEELIQDATQIAMEL